MLASGRLNRLLTLQRPDTSGGKDAYAQDVEAWADVKQVWAEVRALSGREAEAARQLRAEVTHQITIRHDPAALPLATWRFVYGSRVFNVAWVDNVGEANVEVRCQVVEVPAVA